MNQHREKKIVNYLNQFDIRGVPFIEAKRELLKMGFSEPEIVYGMYSAPFDGKDNSKPIENPLKNIYESHPEHAKKVAESLLKMQDENERIEVAAYTLGSKVGNTQTRAYYLSRLHDKLGLTSPIFILFIICIMIGAMFQVGIEADNIEKIINIIIIFLGIYLWYKIIKKLFIKK
jgi:hypothetical protein